MNRIDEKLLGLLEMWLSQGCSTTEVLLKATQWAVNHGHNNALDRSYYITPKEVWYVQHSLTSASRLDENDSVSVDKLVKSSNILPTTFPFGQSAFNNSDTEQLATEAVA